jgi:hypothetical protein
LVREESRVDGEGRRVGVVICDLYRTSAEGEEVPRVIADGGAWMSALYEIGAVDGGRLSSEV